METQSGARTPLVDPFGRELEEWLRDAPATRAPYLSDLVVPPVTGPVQRPDAASETTVEPTVARDRPSGDADVVPADDAAFRRPRDRARHAAVCAPSFPEPPERLALRIEDLAVEVSASSGRTTIERIVILEDEVRRRDEDLARLAAWEASVADSRDPEVEAARSFAHTVFADLLADAAREADRRDRAAARRAATAPVAIVRDTAATSALVDASEVADAIDGPAPVVTDPTTPELSGPARPALRLPVVSPVSANTRPTPLVQPATGPTVIDRAAFVAALSAHGGTASTPVALPTAVVPDAPAVPDARAVPDAPASSTGAPAGRTRADADEHGAEHAESNGWWARLVARIMRALGRR
ncbi:hypothetical protein ACTJKO_11115 [Curtobacterium sp. 22159]|uniref:hypothetical protein n=1 Tax=Curtobacterium sp. 22159 TaxID=3453882 RepID=UPI003F82AE1F